MENVTFANCNRRLLEEQQCDGSCQKIVESAASAPVAAAPAVSTTEDLEVLVAPRPDDLKELVDVESGDSSTTLPLLCSEIDDLGDDQSDQCDWGGSLGQDRQVSVKVSMQDDYNEFCDLQASGGVYMIEKMAEFAAKLRTNGRTELVLAEFGCATGNNSINPIASVLHATSLPLKVIMNDRPQNNWDVLTGTLSSAFEKEIAEGRIALSCAKQSMFKGTIAAKGSINMAFTNYACHWLMECPSKFTSKCWANERPDGDEHKQLWASQSLKDLASFLENRAEEIAHGGMLFLGVWGSNDGTFIMNSYDTMSKAKAHMLEKGDITEGMAANLVFPEYARTLDEVTGVLNEERFANAWDAEYVNTIYLDCPYQQAYQTGALTLSACAEKQMHSSKVVYDLFVQEALPGHLAEKFWDIVQDLSAADPSANCGSTGHFYHVLVLRRL